MGQAVNFARELEQVTDYWSPRVVGRVNDQYVKVAKLKGELVWHKHDAEDELFYIVKGRLVIQYEDKAVTLNQGDFHVVPKGVMHNPVAEEECWIALIETVTTAHTGDVVTERTKSLEDQLGGSGVTTI
ncbi:MULTISPECIES: cupin domain-containing protein [Rhodomicrobium]|uniref:cupin domain-containing protein n=1 Tax=Rhodomicrobium TaxID=1068 RepID=UPI000B4B9EBC|nr:MULTISPECIES: cupin domain-containing protein [Rhodomicrobium]